MLVLFFFFPSLVIPRLSFIKECTKNQQAIVGIVPVSMETNLARGQAVGILEGEEKKTTGNDLTKTLSSPIAPIFQLQGMSNAWTRNVFFKKKIVCFLSGFLRQTHRGLPAADGCFGVGYIWSSFPQ